MGNHEIVIAASWCLADWLTVTLNTHYFNITVDVPNLKQLYADALEILEAASTQHVERPLPSSSAQPIVPSPQVDSVPRASSSVRPDNLFPHSTVFGQAASLGNSVSTPIAGTVDLGDQELKQRVERWECKLNERSVLPWESFSNVGNVKGEIETFIELSTEWCGQGLHLVGTGTILYGPGGTGKTSFVQSLAKKFDLPLFVVGADNLRDKLHGNSEK